MLTIEQVADREVFAVRLHPWAIGAFTERPAAGRDRLAGMDELGLALAAERFESFSERAAAAPSRFPLPPRVDRVRNAIAGMESGAFDSLEAVAEGTGLTVRTLDRRFERTTGLTANLYLRLARFHRARAAIKAGASRLSDVAAEAGYADQAHMTRDFRRFAGETPKRVRTPASFDPLYRTRLASSSRRRPERSQGP